MEFHCATHLVMGFQYRNEAEGFRRELEERMGKFGLRLHPEKTRIIEFGCQAARDREKRGEGKPETFNFLEFTHMCGRTRKNGKFIVKRKTIAKRLGRKLKDIREKLMRNRHKSITEQGKWLRTVVQGFFNYHAVPGNVDALVTFRTQIRRNWIRALRRRSQRHRMNWERFGKIEVKWIPIARIIHPYPNVRFCAIHPK